MAEDKIYISRMLKDVVGNVIDISNDMATLSENMASMSENLLEVQSGIAQSVEKLQKVADNTSPMYAVVNGEKISSLSDKKTYPANSGQTSNITGYGDHNEEILVTTDVVFRSMASGTAQVMYYADKVTVDKMGKTWSYSPVVVVDGVAYDVPGLIPLKPEADIKIGFKAKRTTTGESATGISFQMSQKTFEIIYNKITVVPGLMKVGEI